MPSYLASLVIAAFAVASSTPSAAIPTAAAAKVLAHAHALCSADRARLWGVSLCVPMMLADPVTLEAVSNTQAPGAQRDGSVFRLHLPAGTQVANAPFTYAGRRFAQIIWPMYGDAQTQAVTLMHESFHVVQPQLGFTGDADSGSIAGDPFLDTQPGRVWLRGELAALRTALQSRGAVRTGALRDAVTMRLYRYSLSSTGRASEVQLDILEGLAESTGIDAALPASERVPYALRDIGSVLAEPSFSRAFPYGTGPAYGELLDAALPAWRRRVTPSSDIALMAAHAYGLDVSTPSAERTQRVILLYGGTQIEAQEAARATQRAAMDAKYRKELVSGPVLSLTLKDFHIRFDPRDVETLGGEGTVYHTLSVRAPWGSIDVAHGDALISKDFRTLRVGLSAGTGGRVVRGEGWTLNLSPGYALAADPQRRGSFIVSALR